MKLYENLFSLLDQFKTNDYKKVYLKDMLDFESIWFEHGIVTVNHIFHFEEYKMGKKKRVLDGKHLIYIVNQLKLYFEIDRKDVKNKTGWRGIGENKYIRIKTQEKINWLKVLNDDILTVGNNSHFKTRQFNEALLENFIRNLKNDYPLYTKKTSSRKEWIKKVSGINIRNDSKFKKEISNMISEEFEKSKVETVRLILDEQFKDINDNIFEFIQKIKLVKHSERDEVIRIMKNYVISIGETKLISNDKLLKMINSVIIEMELENPTRYFETIYGNILYPNEQGYVKMNKMINEKLKEEYGWGYGSFKVNYPIYTVDFNNVNVESNLTANQIQNNKQLINDVISQTRLFNIFKEQQNNFEENSYELAMLKLTNQYSDIAIAADKRIGITHNSNNLDIAKKKFEEKYGFVIPSKEQIQGIENKVINIQDVIIEISKHKKRKNPIDKSLFPKNI